MGRNRGDRCEGRRFFICPRSHRLDLQRHGAANNIADNHEVYTQSVVAKMRELGLEIRAPRLEKGDVLFWNAWTIHGSLDSQHAERSRSSVTCHAIPAKDRFLQLQMRVLDIDADVVDGVAVYRPKDPSRLRKPTILWLKSRYRKQFYWLKRAAIRHLSARCK